MNHGEEFTCAVSRMPKQPKWTSIRESELNILKAKAGLIDELVDWCDSYGDETGKEVTVQLVMLVTKLTDKAKELSK